MMVCTEPLPKERVPMTMARLWSWRAPATISEAEAEPPLMSTTRGLPLVRSPPLALKRWVSSALRPRVETISPRSRKASETMMAWSSRPPGLLRRSMTKPLSFSAPTSFVVALDGGLEVLEGLLVERRHAQDDDVVLDAGAHRADADDVPVDLDLEGLLGALALDLEAHARVHRPRILSTAWLRVRPCTCSSSIWVMMSLDITPALAAGVSSMGPRP
jgi:hypothetical protein